MDSKSVQRAGHDHSPTAAALKSRRKKAQLYLFRVVHDSRLRRSWEWKLTGILSAAVGVSIYFFCEKPIEEFFVHLFPQSYQSIFWAILVGATLLTGLITLALTTALLVGGQLLWLRGIRMYLEQSRDRHPVTRKFGNELLWELFTGEFPIQIFDRSSHNLPILLRNLEDLGTKLPVDLYAILLKKSAELLPRAVFAVWDCQTVPISAAFNEAGEVRLSSIMTYFEILTNIYALIDDPEKKPRAFLFADEADMHNQMKHPGWATLMELHGMWGITACRYVVDKREKLSEVKDAHNFPFEDFVYFVDKDAKAGDWFIGYDRDNRHAKVGCGRAADNATEVWHAISVMSRPLAV